MTTLVVEVDDLVMASRGTYTEVAEPVDAALGRLSDVLFSCGAMAGSDEAGSSWSASYDPAAAATLRAAAAAVNGCYRLSAMFAQTGRNYGAADASSTASGRRAINADLAALPSPTMVSFPAPPSAQGGSGGAPTGWSLVQHAVGYVWPNGHQDRLHRAADAWSAFAAALDGPSSAVLFEPVRAFMDGLPEFDDMHAVCWAMSGHLRDLAHAARALAAACRDLAHHIDEVRSQVEDQLFELGAETVGIQILGVLLSSVSAGAAEVPTQGLQAQRIAAVANSVRSLITRFIALAADAIAELPAVKALTERISLVMDRLQSSKLAIAGMNVVPNAPRAARAAELAGTPEVAATERLASEASGLPARLVGRTDGEPGVWGDSRTIEDHFRRHGNAVGATSQADYVNRSSDFLQRAIDEGLPRKIDVDGTIRVYDPATNTFGSYGPDGATRTFFKAKSPTYWDRQPGTPQ